jgi:LacI family transcriptional regulator
MQGRTTIRAPSVQTPKKRSNLRDVAKAAGVSVATVSRVLNAPALVSGETRDRVLSVIETLHFVPSAAARAINSGRTRMVGALVPTLDNAIFARFLSSLEEGLGNFGLSLVVATTDGNDETEAAKAERLVNIGVEALIVSGITHSARFDELIQRTQLPAVATSYFDPAYHLPTVGYDNAAAAALALDHLIALGHRDIASFMGLQRTMTEPARVCAGLNRRLPMQGCATSRPTSPCKAGRQPRRATLPPGATARLFCACPMCWP